MLVVAASTPGAYLKTLHPRLKFICTNFLCLVSRSWNRLDPSQPGITGETRKPETKLSNILIALLAAANYVTAVAFSPREDASPDGYVSVPDGYVRPREDASPDGYVAVPDGYVRA